MLGKIKEYQGVHFLMSFESMLKGKKFAGLEKENIRMQNVRFLISFSCDLCEN